MMKAREKVAEEIVKAAKYVAANTVNKSFFIHAYEPEIPEEVMMYAIEKRKIAPEIEGVKAGGFNKKEKSK